MSPIQVAHMQVAMRNYIQSETKNLFLQKLFLDKVALMTPPERLLLARCLGIPLGDEVKLTQ